MCFAVETVSQQKGTLQAPATGDDLRFLLQNLRRPMWLVGGLLQAGGWTFQAVALDRGSSVVAQSITTLSLAFALPLGICITHQQVGRREVIDAAALVLGIVLFVSVGQSSVDTGTPARQPGGQRHRSSWL